MADSSLMIRCAVLTNTTGVNVHAQVKYIFCWSYSW